jgi:hypothetical protein
MLLLNILLLTAAQPEAKIKPVALVLQAGPSSTVARGAAAGKELKLAPPVEAVSLEDLHLLYPGDGVTAGKEGVVLVFLKDGRRERVLPGKTASVADSGCKPAEAIEPVMAKFPAAAVEALPRLRGEGGRAGVATLRDEPGPAVSPLRGSVVASRQPRLTWPAAEGAVSYEVRLFNGPERQGKPLWTATVKEMGLPYPQGKEPLQADGVFSWTVEAVAADGKRSPVAAGVFSIATQKKAEWLKGLQPLLGSAQADEQLLAATLLQGAGFDNEALPLFEKVASLRPGTAVLQIILANYYTLGGRPKDAEVARQRALKLGWKETKGLAQP